MKRQKLDEAIDALRREQPEESTVRDAARRVFRHVFDSAYSPEVVDRIRGCADFEALIPAYLDRSLSAARTSLFQDHISRCVECRRALQEARRGPQMPKVEVRARRRNPLLTWGLAAALAAGIVLGVTGAFNGLLPGQHAVRASVVTVEGTLYRMNEMGSSLLKAGSLIRNAEELRTGKGSRAIFQLLDGAQIEMGERSDVTISHGWSGTSVEVERGRVIVQRNQKAFLLAAGDLRVPVKNAVLALDRGTKGARVTVAQGSTRVERRGERTVDLTAGQQFPAAYRLQNASLENEFAWSSNADHYRALLQELKTLQKELQAIPSPQLRYSSNLAQYLPSNTVIYAAIPNLGGTISEARKIFEQRLNESEVLRDWWQQQPAARSGEFDRALNQISAISEYLGNEIVFAVTSNGPRQYGAPLFLAEVQRPGLENYLQQNMPPNAKELSIFTGDRIVAASPDASQVAAIRQAVAQGAPAAGFISTPFYQRVQQSYGIGAGYLLAVDMEQTVAKSVTTPKEIPPGFDNVQYLLLERRPVAPSDTETRAALSFTGGRQGVASWLGTPGPMGSLDFVSPDANLAASVIMKNPLDVMKEFLGYASQRDAGTAGHLNDLEQHLGVKLTDDIAALFGGDATFAIDGPLVPVPSWKLAVEVYDPVRLNTTIQTLVDHFNQTAPENAGKLDWKQEEANSRTFYIVRNSKLPDVSVYYTFVDGFLLAGPNQQVLLQAIQNRANGYTLANSQMFKDQLPADNFLNCSALLWHNAGKNVQELANQLKSDKRSLLTLVANSGPGLICVYGEPDRIVAATKGDFLGFNLSTLAGLGGGESLPALMASRKI